MDEAEWLACRAHGAMLEFAIPAKTKATIRAHRPVRDRKLYLFACAACRATWPRLADPRLRSAIEVAERFADRGATRKQLTRAWEEATAVARPRGKAAGFATSAVRHLCASFLAPGFVANDVRDALGHKAGRPRVTDLLRDVYGNLFRPAVVVPAWRTPDVATLALAAYRERAVPSGALDGARLAILADALEDAGCADATILEHLRGPGLHVRGCHVLDAVLGR